MSQEVTQCGEEGIQFLMRPGQTDGYEVHHLEMAQEASQAEQVCELGVIISSEDEGMQDRRIDRNLPEKRVSHKCSRLFRLVQKQVRRTSHNPRRSEDCSLRRSGSTYRSRSVG
jgi:hypothetical protein